MLVVEAEIGIPLAIAEFSGLEVELVGLSQVLGHAVAVFVFQTKLSKGQRVIQSSRLEPKFLALSKAGIKTEALEVITSQPVEGLAVAVFASLFEEIMPFDYIFTDTLSSQITRS